MRNTITFSFIGLQTISIIILRLVFMIINRQRARINKEEIKKQIEEYGENKLVGDHHPEF